MVLIVVENFSISFSYFDWHSVIGLTVSVSHDKFTIWLIVQPNGID
jgi:hypothetical protein